MTIGEVARRSGLPSSTLRFYEKEKLICRLRRISGRRDYDEEVFTNLQLIQKRSGRAWHNFNTRRNSWNVQPDANVTLSLIVPIFFCRERANWLRTDESQGLPALPSSWSAIQKFRARRTSMSALSPRINSSEILAGNALWPVVNNRGRQSEVLKTSRPSSIRPHQAHVD